MGTYTLEIVTELRVLHRGDHLAVHRVHKGTYRYLHCGIFLGHEFGVAEFRDYDKNNDYPQIVDIVQFKGSEILLRAVYPEGQSLDYEKVAKNAETMAENKKWDPYSLQGNNCEHFATYCKTGTASSEQEKAFKSYLNPVPVSSVGPASLVGPSGSTGSLA